MPWIAAFAAVILALVVLIYSCSEIRRHTNQRGAVQNPATGAGLKAHTGPAVAQKATIRPERSARQAGQSAASQRVGTAPAASNNPPQTAVRGGSISGEIVDFTGKSVPGALIRMNYKTAAAARTDEIRTDGAGRFASQSMAANEIESLIVEADGFQRETLQKVPLPSSDVSISLKSLAPLLIRVSTAAGNDNNEKTPYNGEASVCLIRRHTGQDTTRTLSVPQPNIAIGQYVTISESQVKVRDGLTTIQSPLPGIYKIGVKAGLEYAETPPFKIESSVGSEAQVVLGMKLQARGIVKSKTSRQPVAGARVVMTQSNRPLVTGIAQAVHARTADDGRFQLDNLSPGTYVLTIGAEGFTTQSVEEISIVPPAQTSRTLPEAEYYLAELAPSVTVMVSDAGGKPVPRAPLVLFATGSSQTRSYFGRSDGAGLFKFDAVPPGRYTLAITSPENRSRQKRTDLIVGDSEQKTADVRFAALVRINGTMLAAGKPCEGLVLFTSRANALTQEYAKCDAAGAFVIDLEAGEYMASRPGVPGSKLVLVPEAPSGNLAIDFHD